MTYGRPHLHLMRYNHTWRCRDTYGNRGYGATAAEAYNRWVDSVQFHRLANGHGPAPLARAPLK